MKSSPSRVASDWGAVAVKWRKAMRVMTCPVFRLSLSLSGNLVGVCWCGLLDVGPYRVADVVRLEVDTQSTGLVCPIYNRSRQSPTTICPCRDLASAPLQIHLVNIIFKRMQHIQNIQLLTMSKKRYTRSPADIMLHKDGGLVIKRYATRCSGGGGAIGDLG